MEEKQHDTAPFLQAMDSKAHRNGPQMDDFTRHSPRGEAPYAPLVEMGGQQGFWDTLQVIEAPHHFDPNCWDLAGSGSTARRIKGTFGEINLFVAPFADVGLVKFIGENLFLHAAFRAFTSER
jgi:hypothetical protein